MKIILDVTRLVAEGKLTPAEAERLTALASRDTGTLAINMLLSFGALVVACGVVALAPAAETGIALGIVMIAAGLYVAQRFAAQWGLLGTAMVIVGALGLCGGAVVWADGHLPGFLVASAVLLVLAPVARSGLLAALAPLALAGALGSSGGSIFNSYTAPADEPTITIVLFSALAVGAYLVARRAPPAYEGLALTFARVSLLLVNVAFWVGSIWGDRPGLIWLRNDPVAAATAFRVPDVVFVVVWAAALIAVAVWATRANRRWLVNTAATFGAIHFNTQWFERLGANPLSVILAGLLIVAVAVGLWRYNQAAPTRPPA
jgi:hypothetical protein